ncbi:MAG: flagellar export chaperone FliS [Desulfobacteraceae bacterium]|nr:flagellar export chaperone FliS [Desulfobacteraceae bacterium]
MAMNHALNTYQKTAVETADPLQLIILCYDAAIRDLKEARDLHEKHDMDAAYRKIRHAQDIITELLVGLDYERGGDIAKNLNRLYNFVLRRLMGINSREDTAIYGHLIKILSELKSAWDELKLRAHDASGMDAGAPARSWQASA